MIVIGLAGRAGSGKDTVGRCIVEQYGGTTMAFATPLKDACRALFRLDSAQLHDAAKKEQVDERWRMSPRQLMQTLGTDVLRQRFGEDFFIRHMREAVAERVATHPTGFIVITDCRFENEADFVRSIGGHMIHLKRRSVDTPCTHESEQGIGIARGDHVVHNDTSLADLYESAFRCTEAILDAT